MNWVDWLNWWLRVTQRGRAPHAKVFYVLVILLALLGVGCSVALSLNEETAPGWRIGFAVPAIFFLLGGAQAVERLVWPERPLLRSAALSETAQMQILLARWATLFISLGGCCATTLAGFFGSPATQDVCENLRILFFFLIFVCFCLADLAGDQTFPQTMWSRGWQSSANDPRGLGKTRKSFY